MRHLNLLKHINYSEFLTNLDLIATDCQLILLADRRSNL
jgi:hypothetical protein